MRKEDIGPYFGSGSTRPARFKVHQIVDAETVTWWRCGRCQLIVCAGVEPFRGEPVPSLQDEFDRLRREGVRADPWRRECGWNAASPSRRHLDSSFEAHPFETP
ncbi:hypothetical protein GCM10011600_22670 [Pseudolysinimonas yzui]|uniref:Uncharacterized protein n=1 Tax=Pseudolysinimonas yzui TaxID=2708254 RepID=A0A8J3M345_9MICO|nr:hypothetical protein GCM10011600_22670 [Pseudolysinimonas yzui]